MQLPAVRALAVAVLLIASALSGCGSGDSKPASATSGDLLADVKRRGVLVVSTDANYKPQSYRTADGTWVGFDVDVASEVAKRLGVRPEFQDVSFDLITSGNWNGRWDVNVDSMAITPEREKGLLFSQPYYYVPAAFAVHSGSKSRTLTDLKGKRIGLGTATTYQAYLQGKAAYALVAPPADVNIVPYDTDLLAIQDLSLGDGVRLDAVLTALPTIRAAIAAGQPLRVIGPTVFADASAIAIDRNSPLDSRPLARAIDSVLGRMRRDGTLARLSMKYYGSDLTVRK